MKQEYVLMLIVGLIILAYILDAIVNPLSLQLPTPYHFFDPQTLSQYPFTTTSIIIKSIALFLAPLIIMSMLGFNSLIKGISLLVLSGLMQLYALQDIATNAQIIPLEWSLSLTLTGMLLLIPAIIYSLIGAGKKATKSATHDPYFETTHKEDDI